MRETIARWVAKVASISLIATAISPLLATPAMAAATTVPNNITTTDLAALNMTPDMLAQDIAGTGVTVSNVSFVGDKHQAGRVNITDGSIVSFNKGVILSSGNIADIVGPNKSESTTGDMLGGQDADLTALIAASQTVYPMTYDAAVLEFDFVPNASDVYFTYVFGSEEYLEWVNLFDDVFGFWIGNSNQKTNCALTQDGLPVSIDTINNNVNSNQYRDNGYWSPPQNPLNIESDGLTVEMICHATVLANQTNHMKLAIADTSDQILDSMVMIKTDSLSTIPPESCNNTIDDDGDNAIDMSDTQCSSTVTIPSTPSSPSTGTGSNSKNPPFTGSEGEYIVLDGATVGYTPISGVYSAKWAVSQINTGGATPAVCDIYDSQFQLANNYISITPSQPLPVAYALCPKEGEFVANVAVYPTYNASGGDDWGTDVDFFVHNAPPQISLTSALQQTVDVATKVFITTDVYEPGADPYTCKVEWGDGTTEAVAITTDVYGEHCNANHLYSSTGVFAVGVTATDNANASASAGGLAEITSTKTAQTITLATALPTSAVYGSSFSVNATGGASSNPLVYTSSGSCTNVGAVFTMTDGTSNCNIQIDQAGDANYLAAPSYTATVAASKIALAVKANNATKVLGATDPALSYTITSGTLKAGDALTGNVARVAGETVGSYPINQGTLAGGTKYSIAFTAGTFTITGSAPTISSISPTSGGVGTVVTITGTNFNGVTAVAFTGTTAGTTVAAAKFVVMSATQILATVPAGSGTGGISVTNPSGTAKSTTSFKGSTTKVVPTVTSYSVTAARPGNATTTVLTGTNLAAAESVALNGVVLNFSVVSATQISVTVPASGVTTGPIKVTSVGGASTNTIVFSVLSAPTALAAGTSHSCAILADQTAKCWGLNTNGQLGDNSTAQRTSPVAVSGLTSVSSIAAGGAFSCAVTNSVVKCWGLNSSGQLGNGTTTQSLIPVATNITNAVKVVAGATHACALLADSTVKCWGLGTSGQLGNSASLTSSTPITVTGLTSVIALAAGGSSTCAVLTGGAVKCWGLNTNGQLGNGTTTLKNVATAVTGIDGVALKATSVSVGTSHACAMLTSGSAECWGLNSSGQLGDGTTTQRTAPVYVKANATTTFTGFTQLSAGGTHSCAIAVVNAVNTAYCWGAGASGRLGNNATANQTFPVASVATNSSGLTQIVAGGSHTLALIPATTLGPTRGSAWGVNTNGQLGDGTTTAKSVPTLLPLL